MQFGIHPQKNRGIHYSIQYSLIKILRYSVFNSVFTICNFKVFSIQFSIQQAEVLSIQYSTQCSNQFSVFTQYSIHDGIWSIQYSMYSVFRYSLVSLFGTERARLGTFRGFLIFFFKTSKFDSKSPLVIVKLGVDFRKTVLPAQILNFFFWTPNFTKLLNP